MDEEQMLKDLVPDDENLVSVKKTRKKRQSTSTGHLSIAAKRKTFSTPEPFENCNQFIRYYKDIIRLYNKNAKFNPSNSERIPATQILDMLNEAGKNGDKVFLKSWIRYYYDTYLQGSKVYKQDKTSLFNFKKTFKAFNNTYFRG